MDFLKRLLLAVVSVGLFGKRDRAGDARSRRPHKEPWWDSPWGEEDRLGNVNNLSAEGVKKAAGLVKTGKVYALGIPTAPESAAYGTRGNTRSSARRGRMRTSPRTDRSG